MIVIVALVSFNFVTTVLLLILLYCYSHFCNNEKLKFVKILFINLITAAVIYWRYVPEAYRRRETETLGWDQGPRALGWDPRVGPWGGILGWETSVGQWRETLEWDSHVCFFNILNYTVFSSSELQEVQTCVWNRLEFRSSCS